MAIVFGSDQKITFSTSVDVTKITPLDGGGWVSSWVQAGRDGSNWGVFQQLFNPDGTKLGSEVQVNTATADAQWFHHVVALNDGGWVVGWITSVFGPAAGIYQQRFDASGNKVGGEVLVTSASDELRSMVKLDGGGWVMTWDGPVGSNQNVYQRAYDANGNPVGPAVQANTNATQNEGVNPQVVAREGGGWVTIWMSKADGSGQGLFQQVFNAAGQKVGGETRVNTTTAGDQAFQATTALDGGGWVVTWTSPDVSGSSVFQQLYDNNGAKVGGETRVNTTDESTQRFQQVTALEGGGWVVHWSSLREAGTYDILRQVYDSQGQKVGTEVRIHADIEATRGLGGVAALPGGGWIATWQERAEGSDQTLLYQQIYEADGEPFGALAQIQGSDAGSLSSPQVKAFEDGSWVLSWRLFGTDNKVSLVQRLYHIVSDAPEGENNTFELNEDDSHTFAAADFGFTDINDDAPLSVIITTLPGSGTLSLNGELVDAGDEITFADIALGLLTWTPDANDNGDGLASFTFQVRDDGGVDNGGQDTDQSPNTITFDVTPLNDNPEAVADTAVVTKYGSVSGDVLTNDSDIDDDTLTVTTAGVSNITVPALYGRLVLNEDGTFTYFADTMTAIAVGDTEDEIFSYSISDGNGGTSSETITITVAGTDTGNNSANSLLGSIGNDTLTGLGGDDRLDGANGNDTLIGGAGKDTTLGGADNDTVEVSGTLAVTDVINGGTGTDTIKVTGAGAATLSRFNAVTASIERWVGNNKALFGTAGIDVFDFTALTVKSGLPSIDGKAGNDTITGSKFVDAILGGTGNDTLKGGIGNDLLTGGTGADKLEGGTGADRFIYTLISESGATAASRDAILDFNQSHRDLIDLSAIDASTRTSGNQRFSFIGDAAFSGFASELRFYKLSGDTFIEADVTGDGRADFSIRIDRSLTLKLADFVL